MIITIIVIITIVIIKIVIRYSCSYFTIQPSFTPSRSKGWSYWLDKILLCVIDFINLTTSVRQYDIKLTFRQRCLYKEPQADWLYRGIPEQTPNGNNLSSVCIDLLSQREQRMSHSFFENLFIPLMKGRVVGITGIQGYGDHCLLLKGRWIGMDTILHYCYKKSLKVQ